MRRRDRSKRRYDLASEVRTGTVSLASGRKTAQNQGMRTNLKRALLLSLFVAGSVWGDYCGIEPLGLKPLPPIGWNDLVHRCICTNSGQCFWAWVCV